MDIYRNNLAKIIENNFPPSVPGEINIFKNIISVAPMLKYEDFQEKALNQLARLFLNAGYFGEAYKAARLVPPGKYVEASSCVNLFENFPCRGLTVNLEIDANNNIGCPLPLSVKTAESGNISTQNVETMPLADFKGIWTKIKDYTSLLVLAGPGETFLHPKVYEIIDYVTPTPILIETNGNVQIDAERIVHSCVKELIFNVDAADQRVYEKFHIGGDFKKVADNVKAVSAAKKAFGKGPALTLKHFLFKHNEPYLEEMKLLTNQLGADMAQFIGGIPRPFHGENLIREFMPCGLGAGNCRVASVDFANQSLGLNDDLDSPYCSVPYLNPRIKVNGDVTVCPSSARVVGNIYDNSLLEIWSSEKSVELKKEILSNRYQHSDCRACARAQNNFGRLFEGTVMEREKPPTPSEGHTLWLSTLKIDQEYIDYLVSQGLSKDIEYFKKTNAIHPDAVIPEAFQAIQNATVNPAAYLN
ncbi:MAG: SPASM domain-containing protein [Deltaproteobacteria bacterium]|jgi:radical SAM protein with 4Fe4S-binding SPASM domain|nr:SPASM domain-containing protein [Deltaproteobacteria bacterium]